MAACVFTHPVCSFVPNVNRLGPSSRTDAVSARNPTDAGSQGSCTAAGTTSNGIHPVHVYSRVIETTISYPGYCHSLFLTNYALEYFPLGQNVMYFAFEQIMTIVVVTDQEASPCTRKNGFQYIFAPGPKTSTVPAERFTWGHCHQEMKHLYCFHPLITNYCTHCNGRWWSYISWWMLTVQLLPSQRGGAELYFFFIFELDCILNMWKNKPIKQQTLQKT